MADIDVKTTDRQYRIHVEAGILRSAHEYINALAENKPTVLITDGTVDRLYGDRFHVESRWAFDPGEESKTLATVEQILEFMLGRGFGRDATVIALGGGVVGDVAGFAASIYMRGVACVQVPTTLLAQVDSSVGGKTGVNTAYGKNTIGSFWPPAQVLIDPDTLQTLSQRDIGNGMGEVIKHGIIYDYGFFQYLARHFEDLMHLDTEVVTRAISRSCEIKARVVSEDEREQGLRKILNFGHTVGHALESITNYEVYTHGEAVILGMLIESRLAYQLNLIEASYYEELKRVLERFGLQVPWDRYPASGLIERMGFDKKNREGRISFILPTGRGQVKEFLMEREQVMGLWKELAV